PRGGAARSVSAPRAGGGRGRPALLRADAQHADDRALGVALAAQVDAAVDRPERVALRVEEALRSVEDPRPGGAQLREPGLAGLRPEAQLAVQGAEGRERPAEALRIPRVVGILRDEARRLLPLAARERAHERVELGAHA